MGRTSRSGSRVWAIAVGQDIDGLLDRPFTLVTVNVSDLVVRFELYDDDAGRAGAQVPSRRSSAAERDRVHFVSTMCSLQMASPKRTAPHNEPTIRDGEVKNSIEFEGPDSDDSPGATEY